MITVVPGSGRWRLVGRTGRGADVLATGPLTEASTWQEALERLRDDDGDLEVSAPDDRHYRWLLIGSDGTPIAESPPVHRDRAQCQDAFHTARRAADVALADHYHPMADADATGHDHRLADVTTG